MDIDAERGRVYFVDRRRFPSFAALDIKTEGVLRYIEFGGSSVGYVPRQQA